MRQPIGSEPQGRRLAERIGQTMKVKIKRIDQSLSLPKYETAGACCFDMYSRETMAIGPNKVELLPSNLIIEVPEGYMLIVASRSSAPRKKGLLIPHGIGIVDQDYNGPEDEIVIQVLNFTEKEVVVQRGERIAQGCIVPIEKVEFEEVERIGEISRGGVGSTG